MNPDQEQTKRISDINTGYKVVKDIGLDLQSRDLSRARASVVQLQELEHFIRQNLPSVDNSKISEAGFYSPAHAMDRAVALLGDTLSVDADVNLTIARTAADQATRLMAHGEQSKTYNVHTLTHGTRTETFVLPNIIEIPMEWRKSPRGRKFTDLLSQFTGRRKQSDPVGKMDIDLLNQLSNLAIESSEGVRVKPEMAENSPIARDLILICLEALKREAKKSEGSQMPGSQDNIDTVQLIRGIFNYNKQNELEQRIRPSIEFVGLPKIISQPKVLKT